MQSDEPMIARPWRRRDVLHTAVAGIGGLAAARMLPGLPRPAEAAVLVTPNPIKAAILKSGVRVRLVDFSTPPRSSTKKPYALFNFLHHAGDGSGRIFVADSRGKIWRLNPTTGAATLFLDVQAARSASFYLKSTQTGLRSFAFHPDFAVPGRPGYRKLYTANTETAASIKPSVTLFSGPFTTIFHDVVVEWTVGADGRVDPTLRRELFRIAQFKNDHNTDQVSFNPNAVIGDADYGKLYVTVGDGGNVPTRPDPYDQAQDRKSARGKVLRVDPLPQGNGVRYGIPADNPFVGDSDYLPEIWALGLRHPQNLCFDAGGSGAMVLTDIGQHEIEEVNLGVKGANYGWPLREGTFVTDRTDETRLYALPADDGSNGFTYPVAQYDHSEGVAIAGGFVYRGTAIPALRGHYLLGDIVNGRIFHVPVDELRLGNQATLRELTLVRSGKVVTLKTLVAGAGGRVDLRFGQDEAGEMYILTKQDGKVRKLAV